MRQVKSIVQSCNLRLNDDPKYEQFLASPEYYSWVSHNLNDFYAKADYLLSFLLSDPPKIHTSISKDKEGDFQVRETESQLAKSWKLEELNLKVDLESEFHFFFTRFASYITYIKPTFYFISSSELVSSTPEPHVTCKRVIINLALLILFARAFNETDTDIAEILSAVVLQFPQLFGVDDSRDLIVVYPNFAIILFIYIMLYQRIDLSVVDMKRLQSQVKGSFSLFQNHIVKPHREQFDNCLKNAENIEGDLLLEWIKQLRAHYTLDSLRCHLVDLVQTHHKLILNSNSQHREALIPYENCIGLVFKYTDLPSMETENSSELINGSSHVQNLKLQRQNALLSTALQVKNLEIEQLKNEITSLKKSQYPVPTEKIVSAELRRLQSLLSQNGVSNGGPHGAFKSSSDESYLGSIKATIESLLRYQKDISHEDKVRLSDEETTFFEKHKNLKVEQKLDSHYESQFQSIYKDFLKKKQDSSSLVLIPELQNLEMQNSEIQHSEMQHSEMQNSETQNSDSQNPLTNGSLKASANYTLDTRSILETVGEPPRKQLKTN